MGVGDYAGAVDFPNSILNPTAPPALERTDFFNGSFIEHRPDGVIARADGKGNEAVCFDGLAWRVDTLNVNNTITALPASFNSIVWTDSRSLRQWTRCYGTARRGL
jgi:hypothetical protein